MSGEERLLGYQGIRLQSVYVKLGHFFW